MAGSLARVLVQRRLHTGGLSGEVFLWGICLLTRTQIGALLGVMGRSLIFKCKGGAETVEGRNSCDLST